MPLRFIKLTPFRANLLRGLALLVGCLAKFSSGSIFTFNVYSNAIKATFNFTQTEVLLLSSMVNLGLGVGLPAGMVYDRFGPIITSMVGLLSTSVGYILIWSTFRNPEYYSTRNPLMSFYFFIVGHGSLYTYMSALGTNVQNFRAKHRGKVIGLLDACFGGSPAIFVLVYSGFYINGHIKDQQNQNVAGFMLLFAVWFGVVNALCVLFLRVYPPDDSLISTSIPSVSESEKIRDSDNDKRGYASADLTGSINSEQDSCDDTTVKRKLILPKDEDKNTSPLKQVLYLFMDWRFEYLLWMFVCASIVGLAFVNNVTVVTESVGLSDYDTVLTTLIPVTGIGARFILGPLSDHVKERFSRVSMLLLTNIVFALSQLICVFLADKAWAFILANVLSGISIGSLWTFVPAVVSEFFGIKKFGRNWGIIILFGALAGIGIQTVYGQIYESFIKVSGSTNCLGLICVKWNFVLMLGLTVCAILFNIFLVIVSRRQPKEKIEE